MTLFARLFVGLLLFSSRSATAISSSVNMCSATEIASIDATSPLSNLKCEACYEGQGGTVQIDSSSCPPGCCMTGYVPMADPNDIANGNYAAHILYCGGGCCVRYFIDKRTKGGVAKYSAAVVNNVDYQANDNGECVPADSTGSVVKCGPTCAFSANEACRDEESLEVPDYGKFPSELTCPLPVDPEQLTGVESFIDSISPDTAIAPANPADSSGHDGDPAKDPAPVGSGNGSSDSPAAEEGRDGEDGDNGTCFPADAVVFLDNGQRVRMDQLQHGQRVRVSAETYSEVIGFTHAENHVLHDFLTFSTSSGASITLTRSHYLYVNGMVVPARRATIGDMLRLEDGTEGRIVEVKREQKRGLFNPQTMHGDVVVGGVVASTYTTTVPPEMGHALLSPVRALPGMCGAVLAGIADVMRAVVRKNDRGVVGRYEGWPEGGGWLQMK